LAIDAGRRLTLDEIAELAEAFSDSDLPYKVDLVDWHDIDHRWRQTIAAERVALAETAETRCLRIALPAGRRSRTARSSGDRDQAAGLSCTSIAIK
jgi:hypothetical protein